MKLVLASSNAGKLVELRELLGGSGYQLIAQGELGVSDADETGLTFVENALLKARNAARETGLPALGDDSGLCVDALGGAPGLYSARYAGRRSCASLRSRHLGILPGAHGDATRNIDKLLGVLHGVPDAQRGARFYCVLVLLRHAEDPQPVIAEGVWPGVILQAPRGNGGFGYDPVFLDPEHDASAAELDAGIKNRISHRGRALSVLREKLALLSRNQAENRG